MDHTLQVFNFEEMPVRTVLIDGEIWFVGKDVAEILGYENPTKALRMHVDPEDKKMGVQNVTPYIIDALGRKQYPTFINESAIYTLAIKSNQPNAKPFRRWITSDVLPKIRKTGQYSVTGDSYLIEDPIERAYAWIEERKKMQALELKTQEQQKVIEEYEPKVQYCDKILQSDEVVNTTIIAKDYGMSAKELNKRLNEMRIQYKSGTTWVLYSQYQAKGYTKTKTKSLKTKSESSKSVTYTGWTQKGRLFMYEQLKQNGILPLIERENN